MIVTRLAVKPIHSVRKTFQVFETWKVSCFFMPS